MGLSHSSLHVHELWLEEERGSRWLWDRTLSVPSVCSSQQKQGGDSSEDSFTSALSCQPLFGVCIYSSMSFLFIHQKICVTGLTCKETWEDTVKTHNVRVVNTSLDTSVCVQTSRLMLSCVSVNKKITFGYDFTGYKPAWNLDNTHNNNGKPSGSLTLLHASRTCEEAMVGLMSKYNIRWCNG